MMFEELKQDHQRQGQETKRSIWKLFLDFLRQLPRQCLRIFFQPTIATMAEEAGKANILVLTFQILLLLFSLVLCSLILFFPLNAHFNYRFFISFLLLRIYILWSSIILVFFYVLVEVLLFHSLAYIVGGRGRLVKMLYVSMLFLIPSFILGRLFGATYPIIYNFFGLYITITISFIFPILLQIYIVILCFLALRAIHRLSWPRALFCVIVMLAIALCAILFLHIPLL